MGQIDKVKEELNILRMDFIYIFNWYTSIWIHCGFVKEKTL